METWTTSQVREFLKLGSAAAARNQLRRWGVPQAVDAEGRALHDAATGEKLWPADMVRGRQDERPRPHYSRRSRQDNLSIAPGRD